MTQAAERSGYALVENYLYTVEAFRDYLDHLKPGGQVVFKVHGQLDLERVLRTAIRVLEERGIPTDQVTWYLQALSEAEMLGQHGGEIMYPLLVVRREPYTLEEAQHHLSAAVASGYVPLYLPGVGGIGPLSELDARTEQSSDPDSHRAGNLSPTTDDRSFFALPPLPRVLVAAGLVAPLGKVMGVPLPSGLGKLAELSATPLPAPGLPAQAPGTPAAELDLV